MNGKLILDLEALAVETFAPEGGGDAAVGTVESYDATETSCQNTTRVGYCFCTECQTCRNCA